MSREMGSREDPISKETLKSALRTCLFLIPGCSFQEVKPRALECFQATRLYKLSQSILMCCWLSHSEVLYGGSGDCSPGSSEAPLPHRELCCRDQALGPLTSKNLIHQKGRGQLQDAPRRPVFRKNLTLEPIRNLGLPLPPQPIANTDSVIKNRNPDPARHPPSSWESAPSSFLFTPLCSPPRPSQAIDPFHPYSPRSGLFRAYVPVHQPPCLRRCPCKPASISTSLLPSPTIPSFQNVILILSFPCLKPSGALCHPGDKAQVLAWSFLIYSLPTYPLPEACLSLTCILRTSHDKPYDVSRTAPASALWQV